MFLRTTLVYGLATLLSLLALTTQAQSDYPSKPVRLIIPFQGGITEQLGRAYAVELEKALGRPVIIDVRPGAGGSVGARYAARTASDGYTLVIGSNGLTIQHALAPNPDFDPFQDLEPITPIMSQPFLLYVHPDNPIQTLADYLAHARANPDRVSYGSVGPNTPAHLIGELLAIESGTRLTHVSYRGGGAQALAVMSGEATSGLLTSAFLKPYAEASSLRPIVIASHERSPLYPEVPTFVEAGFPNVADIGLTWFALYAPRGLPQAVQQRLVEVTNRIYQENTIPQLIRNWGGVPLSGGPESLLQLQKSNYESYSNLKTRLEGR